MTTTANNQPPRIRTEPAAEYCGSTKSTLEKLRLTGDGPAYIKIGRVGVYDRNDLDAWLVSNKRLSTSEQEAGND